MLMYLPVFRIGCRIERVNATATYYAVMTWNNLLSLQLTQTTCDVELRSVAHARLTQSIATIKKRKKTTSHIPSEITESYNRIDVEFFQRAIALDINLLTFQKFAGASLNCYSRTYYSFQNLRDPLAQCGFARILDSFETLRILSRFFSHHRKSMPKDLAHDY